MFADLFTSLHFMMPSKSKMLPAALWSTISEVHAYSVFETTVAGHSLQVR